MANFKIVKFNPVKFSAFVVVFCVYKWALYDLDDQDTASFLASYIILLLSTSNPNID